MTAEGEIGGGDCALLARNANDANGDGDGDGSGVGGVKLGLKRLYGLKPRGRWTGLGNNGGPGAVGEASGSAAQDGSSDETGGAGDGATSGLGGGITCSRVSCRRSRFTLGCSEAYSSSTSYSLTTLRFGGCIWRQVVLCLT
jgi:hypothetical protein